MLVKIASLLALVTFSQCALLGVDVSQLFSPQNFTCMKNQGVTFAIARGYYSSGSIDHNVIQSLTNIKQGGLQADTYMFPCRGKNATTQTTQLVNGIPAHLYNTIWLDVETNPSPGCSWTGHDAQSNCQFLLQLVNSLRKMNKNVGIYASRYMWGSILGSYDACSQASTNVPLWYAHYDGVPSFSDFVAFAGWKRPTIKQYQGTSSFCGASVDRNYRAQ